MLHHLGADCNLGNIAADDVLSLETLRLGLRSDTVERFAVDGSRPRAEARQDRDGD
jgi:phosphosulfolactate synthase